MTGIDDVRDISRIAYGFMASKALFSALNFDLFARLEAGPKTLEQLADETGIAPNRLSTLLTALTGPGLLIKADDAYANSTGAARYLIPGKPAYFGDYYRYQIDRQIYDIMGRLDAGLRGNAVDGMYTTAFKSQQEAEDFSKGQHSGSMGPAFMLARAVDMSGAGTLLDIAGGSGAFSITLCNKYDGLSSTILDFPNVCDVGAKFAADAGLADRISFAPGNAITSDWPHKPGAPDVVLVSYLMSAIGETEIKTVIDKAWAALPPGGQLVVHDFMLNNDRAGPTLSSLWGLVSLIGNPDAVMLTPGWLKERLGSAGFTDIQSQPLIEEITQVVTARKPA
jgi:ubiquinone/menaquinone biosynthesis C-methylase UbiE